MARVLNPQSKAKIISNAIEIMHKEGYQALSMRKVAFKSNMVVGNVYRYFKNKEEIEQEIFQPVYQHLDSFLNIPFDQVKMIHPSKSEVKNFILNNIESVVENINDLLKVHYKEFQIIFKEATLSKDITLKVSLFLQALLKNYFPLNDDLAEESKQLLKMFSNSLIAGVIEAINDYPHNKKIIATLIKDYLSIYINLMDIEIPQK